MPTPGRQSKGFGNKRKGGGRKGGAKLARGGGDLPLGPDSANVSGDLTVNPPSKGFRSGQPNAPLVGRTASPSTRGASKIQRGAKEQGQNAGKSGGRRGAPKAANNTFGVRQTRKGFRTGS